MFKHVVFRIIAGLILLAAIAGIAFFAYQAGMTHAAAANLQVPAAESSTHFFPFYAAMHPFFGFGFFGMLFIFFLIALAFGAMRRLVWGPRWGWRHMGHGPMGHYDRCAEGVPPMFNEWHKRVHEDTGKAPEESQK